MLHEKKIVVVMPAYRAESTLKQAYHDIPFEVVDEVLLVDDASTDRTLAVARELGLKTFVHSTNLGYGANQKTCYKEALRAGADVVVMLHPDYQYDPRLITAMASMVTSGAFDVVLGSRILGGGALRGGMPLYKYVANRFLTLAQNLLIGAKLSEFHTGYRSFSRPVLESLPLLANSDDFVFDNEMLAQAIAFGYRVGEISCPTKYFAEASSISFRRSVKYGFGVLGVSLLFRLAKMGLMAPRIFNQSPTLRLSSYYETVDPSSAKSPGSVSQIAARPGDSPNHAQTPSHGDDARSDHA
jgi:glycosyltransferase involved in cell wall biosynthesis